MRRFATVCFALLALLTTFSANAMFKLDYEITIGNYKLQALEKVAIETSQELLSDSCKITIPGMVAGQPILLENKIKRGDAVTVQLGYNGELVTEFTGYLKAIYPDTPVVLECEDSVYLFRRKVASKIFKDTNIKAILDYVLAQVNPQIEAPFKIVTELSGDSYKWDSFAIRNATGFEVLDKLRQESGLMIYARGNELHCHLAFGEVKGEVIYDYSVNVEASTNLKYVSAQDQKMRVTVVGRTDKGAKVEGVAGEEGGDEITIQRPTVSDKATLDKIAEEELKKRVYDGYRGEIDGWLIPYCTTGYSAIVRNPAYPEGRYYVTATKVEFGPDGGYRSPSLGLKLS